MVSIARYYRITNLLLGLLFLIGGLHEIRLSLAQSAQATVDPQTGEVNTNGEIVVDDKLVQRILETSRDATSVEGINEQDAIDIGAIIQRASTDPETSLLLLRMTQQGGKDAFDELRADMNAQQIVFELAETVQEMRALETLYTKFGPSKAYEELLNDGLVPEGREAEYKKNPELLEEDIRKQLYFTFITLAATGGYL